MREDDLYLALKQVVANGIGDRLSEYPTQLGTAPAIFKGSAAKGDNANRLYGILPYCQIVAGIKTRDGAKKHYSFEDVSTGDRVTRTNKTVQVTINIVGGDATDICSDLEDYFLTSEDANVYLNRLDIGVVDSFGVVPQTTLLSNQAHDSAFMLLTLSIYDDLVETSYEINTVSAGFNIRYDGSEDDLVSTTIDIP